jgi:hypothetical protein
VLRIRRTYRLGSPLNRSSNAPAPRWAKPFSKQNLRRVFHVMGPTLAALLFVGVGSGVAHAQGTMDFSGAQTLVGTFKTFAIYAGAVICFGGLIFAGIRMVSGRFPRCYPRPFRCAVRCRLTRMGRGLDWLAQRTVHVPVTA